MRFLKAFLAHALTACITFAAVLVYLQSGYAWLNVANVRVCGMQGEAPGAGVEINHGGMEIRDGKAAVWIVHQNYWGGKDIGPHIYFDDGHGVQRFVCASMKDQQFVEQQPKQQAQVKIQGL